MKPRFCRIFRKSDLKAVIASHSGTFMFYDICSKSAETWPDGLPLKRALWHYKMCPFGTSAGTPNGNQSDPKKGRVFPESSHFERWTLVPRQDVTKAQLP